MFTIVDAYADLFRVATFRAGLGVSRDKHDAAALRGEPRQRPYVGNQSRSRRQP